MNTQGNIKCKYFRAKSPYGGMSSAEDVWPGLDTDNLANCWCVKTQAPSAPDGGFVDPTRCVVGRKCYVSPD